MKRIVTLLCLMLLFQVGFSNAIDTLIVDCKIKDAKTHMPVKAKVRFESLPYGNKLGLKNDSTVTFYMFSEEEFKVVAEAEGYLPQTVAIKYDDFIGAQHIEEIVELMPSEIGVARRLETLAFEPNSDIIHRVAHAELNQLASTLMNNPGMVIQLEGILILAGILNYR